MFEVRYTDLAARIGRLETPHGIVETPAFVPVVHPVRQTINPQFLKKMGFDLVITNAYITLKHYGVEARKRGIHDIIGFDGAVMTDSGGYQVLEYGSVEVEPSTMALFEKEIKSDIPVPLDRPTGYGLTYEKAKEYVDVTLANCEETLRMVGETDAIWVGPVQGAEHFDLVERSATTLDRMGFGFMALGSPVELMEAYEFATLARMIGDLPCPTVIRLVRYVHVPRKFRRQVTNTFLFARDGYRCMYCGRHRQDLKGREFLTRDHVTPLSRGNCRGAHHSAARSHALGHHRVSSGRRHRHRHRSHRQHGLIPAVSSAPNPHLRRSPMDRYTKVLLTVIALRGVAGTDWAAVVFAIGRGWIPIPVDVEEGEPRPPLPAARRPSESDQHG